MASLHLFLVTIIVSIAMAKYSDPKMYTTELGHVEGFYYRTKSGFDTGIYLGVPYAKPPIGSLRFAKPQRISEQSKKAIQAKEFGPSCYPHHRDALDPNKKYSENCLTMNIMAPYKRTFSCYPVLFIIHGGGFESGDSKDFGYKYLAEHYVSKGIVVVTVNYRLGFLGFLTNGQKELPGNIGIWDQIRALQFVHDNIVAFCGNPNEVTIIGHSAGSMCVSALTLTQYANNLFKRAISLSGSALAKIALNERTVSDSRDLVNAAGCNDESFNKMLKCMKGKSVDALMDAVDTIGSSRKSPFALKFQPRIDGDLLINNLETIFGKVREITTVIGTANQESALAVLTRNAQFTWNLTIPETKYGTFNREDFEKYLKEYVVTEADYGEDTEELEKILIEFYLQNGGHEAENANFYIKRIVEMLTDIQFSIPAYFEAQMKMSHGWPIYFYVQEYANEELHKNRSLKGAYHANEYPYLFGINVQEKFKFNDMDIDFRRLWQDIIINTVLNGDPRGDRLKWDRLNSSDPSRYLSLTPKPKMKGDYSRDKVHFWTKRVPKRILSKMLAFNIDFSRYSDIHDEL